MKRLYSFLLVVALLLPMKVGAQTLSDAYAFTTGVDSSQWVTLSSNATSVPISGDDAASQLFNIGFTFRLCGVDYTQWSCNTNGCIRLGSNVISTAYSEPFSSSSSLSGPLPLIAFCGADCNIYSGTNWVKYEMVGEEGGRVLVIQYHNSIRNQSQVTADIQVQFAEADQSITLVYGERTGTPSVSYQVGLASSTPDIVMVVVATNTMNVYQSTTSVHNASGSWPGLYRWYKFTYNPNTCTAPGTVELASNLVGGTTISWSNIASALSYSVVLDDSLYFSTADTFYTPCLAVTSSMLPYYQDF